MPFALNAILNLSNNNNNNNNNNYNNNNNNNNKHSPRDSIFPEICSDKLIPSRNIRCMLTTIFFNFSPPTGGNRARKSVIRMLVVVVVLFTVCWLPYHIISLYQNFKGPGHDSNWFFQLLMFSLWLMFANSCCNPVVYAVLNRNYRREFVRLLR